MQSKFMIVMYKESPLPTSRFSKPTFAKNPQLTSYTTTPIMVTINPLASYCLVLSIATQ